MRAAFATLAVLLLLPEPAARASDEELLARKAALYRDALVSRHLASEGMVLYRVNLSTLEGDLASGRYANMADTPTFTGLFAATSCTRATLESEPARSEALGDAATALRGLRFLMDVTGVPGLLARGARRARAPLPDEGSRRWIQGTGAFAEYRWRGDVSMDQYANGLLPAIAECRELFPEQTRALAVDFARHLLEHDLRLVDPDGRVTRYGNLGPRSGLGWNTIAQLVAYASFALAADLDPDPRFGRRRDELRTRYLTPLRTRTTNLRVLRITNHSNDLMSWNLYRSVIPLARRTRDPGLPELRHGMHRTWLRAREDGNAYFAALLCRIEPRSCNARALADAAALLARFPLDRRKLAPPAELAEIPRRWLPGRRFRALARRPVPIELRPASSYEWKSSPYRLEGGADPDVEYTGLDFLSAYWVYRGVNAQVHP